MTILDIYYQLCEAGWHREDALHLARLAPTLGTQTMSLKEQLLAIPALGLTDADFAHHASDLYVVAKPGVHDAIKKLRPTACLSVFTSQTGSNWNGAGKLCWEVTFGRMDEYVQERQAKRSVTELPELKEITE